MATSPRAAREGADAPPSRKDKLTVTSWTDCALCGGVLPTGNRYLCAACVAENAAQAAAMLAAVQAGPPVTAKAAESAVSIEVDVDEDAMACPACGMRLDDSGRCAGCVTTVRR